MRREFLQLSTSTRTTGTEPCSFPVGTVTLRTVSLRPLMVMLDGPTIFTRRIGLMNFSTLSKAALLLLALALLVPGGQLLTAQGNGAMVTANIPCDIAADPLEDPAPPMPQGPFNTLTRLELGDASGGVRHRVINKKGRHITCKEDIPDDMIPDKAVTFRTTLTVGPANAIVFDCSYTYTPSGRATRTCSTKDGG